MDKTGMTTRRARTLSKSDFKIARTCDAKLWFRENGYPDNRESNAYLQLLAYGGYMVEALANSRYPHGIELEYGGDHQTDCDRTLELLQRDTVTIFQGTLVHGRRLARLDILDKSGNTIRLIEVKAKSFDGKAHMEALAAGLPGSFRQKRKPHFIDSEWAEKIEDLAYQVLLLERLLPGVTIEPWLALVDKSKRSALNDVPNLFRIDTRPGKDGKERLHSARFIGTPEQVAQLDLVTEVRVADEVAMLRDDVESAALRFEEILDAPFDTAWGARGSKCKECEFNGIDAERSGFHHCWGELAHAKPHILDLFSVGNVKLEGRPLVESLLESGKASLFDVPEDCLTKADGTIGVNAERQRRQIACTREERTWYSDELRGKIDALEYPLHFIDFEVSRLALPYHSRMRPYGQVAFQWSCHTVASPGASPVHREWLNTNYEWPNRTFVSTLREAIGDGGPIIAWSPFEGSSLKEINRELEIFDADDPVIAEWIVTAVDETKRMVDICKWAAKLFYHPAMGGRTSIKVVTDALWKHDSELRKQFTDWTGMTCGEGQDPYHSLPDLTINGSVQDVREGTGAIRAYEAMMYGVEREDSVAKAQWSELLRNYCRLDTLSMVLIFEHWRRNA